MIWGTGTVPYADADAVLGTVPYKGLADADADGYWVPYKGLVPTISP
jgi:hypothetical protein